MDHNVPEKEAYLETRFLTFNGFAVVDNALFDFITSHPVSDDNHLIADPVPSWKLEKTKSR